MARGVPPQRIIALFAKTEIESIKFIFRFAVSSAVQLKRATESSVQPVITALHFVISQASFDSFKSWDLQETSPDFILLIRELVSSIISLLGIKNSVWQLFDREL